MMEADGAETLPAATLARLCAAAPGVPASAWAAIVAPTRSALERPGVRTHASVALPLAAWVGLGPEEAATCRDVLDLLQLAIDVSDNVADASEDAAAGLALEVRYDGVPLAVLAAVPALVLAVVVDLLHRGFPAPRTGASAAARIVETLSVMAWGQSLVGDWRAKVEAVSAAQGALLCLPLWVAGDVAAAQTRAAEADAWARRFGRTWELAELAEAGHPDAARELFREDAVLRIAWPAWGPFAPGGALDRSTLLGRGMT
jgi:hypothetical protein